MNKVRINGIDYSLEETDDIQLDGENVDGYIDFGNATIVIKHSLSPQLQSITMLHEMLHGIVQSIGAYNNFLDRDTEEKVCDIFARGIYQIMKDNGIKTLDYGNSMEVKNMGCGKGKGGRKGGKGGCK